MADENTTPHLHVEFFTDPVENKKKSAEAGRPIFEDREFVRIRFRGDRNRTLIAPANEKSIRHPEDNTRWLTYAERFPRHYEAFKQGQQYFGDGTPLAELPFLTKAKVAELKALNIHTAEALAGIDGTPLKQLGMGGRELKEQAQAYLDKAAGNAVETKLMAENADLAAQIKMLQEQMAQIQQAGKPMQSGSAFALWQDSAIKDFIAQKTGSRPKGNPSHDTLIRMAEEINQQAETEAA